MYELVAGRLYWKKIRKYFEECKFIGCDIEYLEGDGFASRTFLIKGKDAYKVYSNLVQQLPTI